MKVEGGAKLARQLRSLSPAARRHVSEAIEKSGGEGVRVARRVVPVAFGELKGTIRFKADDDGMSGKVIAGEPTSDGQQKANTVEGGRRPDARGGAMAAQPFIGVTRSYLAKKFKGRISRAIRKAAKEAARHG